MAGGVGSRFWPLSRNNNPKQFLDILGTGQTLLQQTFARAEQNFPSENIYIVTNQMYNDLVKKQLPQISQNQILLEPMRRNTAPCITYATFKIMEQNPNAIFMVAPSDHLITKEIEFVSTVKQGLDFVQQNEALLTIGISPTRPETGYGYIQINSDNKFDNENVNIKKVKTFTEKPNYEMAKIFFESKEFFWNAGIFIWSGKTIMNSIHTYLPEVYNLFSQIKKVYNTTEEAQYIDKVYPECQNISIDYGVMEKANNVYVYGADLGWSDLGTWGSLYENSDKDVNGNALNGSNSMFYNSSNCVVNAKNNKLVVIQGLDDYIVVDTDDVLLICRKREEQQIRQFVNDVKIIEKGEQYI